MCALVTRGLPRGSFTQHVKDRARRTQSENSFSGFAEPKPIFEAQPQRAPSNALFCLTVQRYGQ